MRGLINRRTILYSLIAALIFVGLLLMFYPVRQEKKNQECPIILFGDSVPGIVRDATGIAALISESMGVPVCNAAFGGTCVARIDQDNALDYWKDSLSLTALTKAVYLRDFGPQNTAHFREVLTEYIPEAIAELSAIDFQKTQVVLIEQGVNDFYSGIALDNEKDSFDEYTFKGALRRSFEALKKANDKMRIVYVTPTYTWFVAKNQTCEEFDAGYGNMEVYIAAIKEVAAAYDVEVLDLYHDFFPHESWEDWERYTLDGIHPTEEGRHIIADRIENYLKGEGK